MKTFHQRKFEDLVVASILCEPFLNSRSKVLEDFKIECDYYYDLFCDQVYDLMMRKDKGLLLIDERGFSYTDRTLKNQHHMYYCVLCEEDFKEDIEDIIFYIELALKHFEQQILQIQNCFR